MARRKKGLKRGLKPRKVKGGWKARKGGKTYKSFRQFKARMAGFTKLKRRKRR